MSDKPREIATVATMEQQTHAAVPKKRYGVYRTGPGNLCPVAPPSTLTEALRLAAHVLRSGDDVAIRKS